MDMLDECRGLTLLERLYRPTASYDQVSSDPEDHQIYLKVGRAEIGG